MLLFYSNFYYPRDFKTYKFQNKMNIARTMITDWDAWAHQLKLTLFELRGNNYTGRTKRGVNSHHISPCPAGKVKVV